jgi:hypothetical protein
MQIEEHKTGFDLTLTLEQLTAEQIGEEVCPHSRRPPRRTRVLCSAAKEKTPAEPELARESTAAGFARARKRTDEEPLDGDAPTLRWTRTPARGPAPAPTSRPPPKGRRLLVCEEKKHKKEERSFGGPWLDGGTPARARRPELPAAAAMPPSPASSARTVASIGEKRKGRRAREKRKEARREPAMARRADRPARRQDATGGGAGPELGHKERENG